MTAEYLNNWHRVWSNRTPVGVSEGSELQRLIALDGFDSPLGLMLEAEWAAYVDLFARRSGVRQQDSIFEVGCGSGAFLYPFVQRGHRVSGIDYAPELINVARAAMPAYADGLQIVEAAACSVVPSADVAIANHVVHYFPSLAYAERVIDIMLRKASRVVSLSGLPDEAMRQESEDARRSLLTVDEYQKKYRGLEILYFGRGWLADRAAERGFEALFFPHEMPGFAQNQFRFDCVMTKARPEDLAPEP